MRLSNFKFKLPEEQIAQFPSRFRDDARLLVLHAKTGEIEHKTMTDLASYFDEGDIMVANDTKVFPARLYAQKEKTLANIEVFLLRELQHENRYWDVLVDPARKIRIGNKLFFDEDATIVAEVIDNTTSEELAAWYQAVEILHPKQVMIYVIDRATPLQTLEKIPAEQMQAIAKPLLDKGIEVIVSV